MYQIAKEKVEILVGRNQPNANLSLITLDTCLSENQEYRNKISSYPVENGLDVSDHIYQEPDEVKIEGVVTNTPDLPTDKNNESGEYVASAFNALLDIVGRFPAGRNAPDALNQYPNPITVDIIGTRNRVYTDMICESLSIPATKETGDALIFTISFKKVRKVSTSMGTITYNVAGGSDQYTNENSLGKKLTTPLTDEQNLAATKAELNAAFAKAGIPIVE
jgi:hypothetical protein